MRRCYDGSVRTVLTAIAVAALVLGSLSAAEGIDTAALANRLRNVQKSIGDPTVQQNVDAALRSLDDAGQRVKAGDPSGADKELENARRMLEKIEPNLQKEPEAVRDAINTVRDALKTGPPPASMQPAPQNPATSIAVAQIPPVAQPPQPKQAEVVPPSVKVLYTDDPELLRNSPMNVHAGARWRLLTGGNSVDVYRDNPPMTGVIDIPPDSLGAIAPTNLSPFWNRNAQLSVLRNLDFFLAGSDRHTFTDAENDGLLGVALAGDAPRAGTAARVRWHSNGLQLDPGVPVDLFLVRRGSDEQPQRIAGASGTVRLDPGTIVVGIAVSVIYEVGVAEPIVDRAMAELWFDGRTAGRLPAQRAPGVGLTMRTVLDRDPHPGWSPDRLDAPVDGRRLNAMGQEIDGVWSYCGENYHRNIQFRMVRFGRLRANSGGAACALAASTGRRDILPSCIREWGNALQTMTGDHRPAINVVIVSQYPTTGVAQSWSEGALISQDALTGGYGRNTVAHELGHVLGWGSPLFNDGIFHNNLMSGGAERTLLREQCELAYTAAAAYSLFPRK